jgi:hypothetical protein
MTVDGIEGFKPYMGNGFQKIVETNRGRLSIRFGGRSLFVRDDAPFEVWYPEDDAPSGYQTAEDIQKYLNTIGE